MTTATDLLSLVKARCDAKGWTLVQAAKRAKMSVAGLRKICSGIVADPRGPTIRGLATMLDADPSEVRAAIASGK